jgi:hypothetical protein
MSQKDGGKQERKRPNRKKRKDNKMLSQKMKRGGKNLTKRQ